MHSYPLPRHWPQVTFPDYRYPNSGARPDRWASPFVPFVWLGDQARGLEWCCETDEAWRPRRPEAALQLRTVGDTVEFTCHLRDEPAPLTQPLRFTFALQAGPVKPPSPQYRQGRFGYSHWGTFGMETQERSPGLTQLDYLKGLGVRFVGMHEEWTDFQGMPRVTQPERLRALVAATHAREMGLVLYHSLAIPDIVSEFAAMGAESLLEPRSANYVHSREPFQHDYGACHRGKYRDLWVEGIARLFAEYGVDGLYLDGASCPVACANQAHGCGYTDATGSVRPTYPIFAARETMQRLRAICDRRPTPTLIVAHMSSLLSLPSLSFADMLLTGEQCWKAPESFRPPLEFIQAECMGHNHGLPTDFIGYPPLGGEYARQVIALHNAPSSWCPGGVEIWGLYDRFDADGAAWYPYWGPDPLATADAPGVLISGLRHPAGRALLAVGNTRIAPQRVQVTLLGRLRMTGVTAREAFTAAPLPLDNGQLGLDLGPEGTAWVWLDGVSADAR
jgi:hypothetical protein